VAEKPWERDPPEGLVFHEEYSPIDPWDDILDDGKIKYRTLADAWEEYKRINEERYG
jgi:hypothetical protein